MVKQLNWVMRRSSRGFSIVELLVVIGVVGILLALLIPALSMARQTANAVKCLGKQRQFMQAIMSYAADHDGAMPAPNWGNGPPQPPPANPQPPQGWLYNPNALSFDGTHSIRPGFFSENDIETGLLYPYLKNHDVYHCTTNQATYDSSTVQIVTSFIMNGAVCGFGNGGKPYDLKSFAGSALILWEIPGALTGISGDVNDGANWPPEAATTRHKHGSTCGFLDGHAELLTWQQFTDEWYNHIPGRLWCAPHQADGGKLTWVNHIAPTPWPSSPPPEPTVSDY